MPPATVLTAASVEGATERVLDLLGATRVEALAKVCAPLDAPSSKAMGAVVSSASVSAQEAVKALRKTWKADPSLTGAGVALALRVGARARRDREACRGRAVWTGPEAALERRLTAGVLHELIAGARERVLLVSYAAYTLPGLAADLGEAVARGCLVDLVFETTEDSGGKYTGGHGTPFASVTGATRWRWPGPRNADAQLHAKVLVVDGRRALVGSANLTAKALNHNLEAGVLIEDPALAAELEAHVRSLMEHGVLV